MKDVKDWTFDELKDGECAVKFSATIEAQSRRQIIEELRFFIEQIELEADGGGSDEEGLHSRWGIKDENPRITNNKIG